jgi:hypothetical protein
LSWRRIRNLLLFLLVVAAGYWYYRDRPTMSEFVDDLTRPLFGSNAAVKESERKRVISDAQAVISQQTDENVATLRLGMSMADVRDLLGNPDEMENLPGREPARVRWLYRMAKRVLVFENGRVASIAIL